MLPKGSGENSHIGYWSDGKQTTVDVGVWGHNEPNEAAGECAMVDMETGKWYMAQCYTILPLVCEMDPCPGGMGLYVTLFLGASGAGSLLTN